MVNKKEQVNSSMAARTVCQEKSLAMGPFLGFSKYGDGQKQGLWKILFPEWAFESPRPLLKEPAGKWKWYCESRCKRVHSRMGNKRDCGSDARKMAGHTTAENTETVRK